MRKLLRNFYIAVFAMLIIFTHLSAVNAEEAVQVTISDGVIEGTVEDGLVSFKGIPYAAPPVGDLRWMPPQPAVAWEGVLEAKVYQNQPAQNKDLGVFAEAGGSEDCLYVNVFYDEDAAREAMSKNEKLPVFVWIYGGALNVGSASDYDPSALARDGKAMVVTFGYRLGILGLFAHPAIDAEGHANANYGLMDQMAALKWVQNNIASFGGDADNVTIAGESAGGQSVLALMTNQEMEGTFQQAISMSGNTIIHHAPLRNMELADAETIGIKFAEAAGLENDSAEDLRNLTTEEVLKYQSPYLIGHFIVDGDIVKEHIGEALDNGHFNKDIVFVNGTVQDEGRFFAGLREYYTGKVMDEEDYRAAMYWLAADFKAQPEKIVGKMMAEYPVENYNSYAEAFAAAVTDCFFSATAAHTNRAVAKYTPVYAYEFADRTAPAYLGSSLDEGAAHTYELSYIFPGFNGASNISTSLNEGQKALSAEMIYYWTHAKELPAQEKWQSFTDKETNNYFKFNLPTANMSDVDFDTYHHVDFWESIGI